MNDSDIQLKLLANLPVSVGIFGEMKLPTIREIITMGESTYHSYLSSLLFTKDNLGENNQGLDEFSDWQILMEIIKHDNSFKELFFNALNLFFDEIPKHLPNGIVYFGDPEDEKFLDEASFKTMQRIVKIGNFIEEKNEDYQAADEITKKFIEKLKKKNEKLQQHQKQKINLHSLISALAWKGKVGIDRILDCTIYQLYDGHGRLSHIDNFYYTMTGIYSGTVDSKKIKMSEINWANILK